MQQPSQVACAALAQLRAEIRQTRHAVEAEIQKTLETAFVDCQLVLNNAMIQCRYAMERFQSSLDQSVENVMQPISASLWEMQTSESWASPSAYIPDSGEEKEVHTTSDSYEDEKELQAPSEPAFDSYAIWQTPAEFGQLDASTTNESASPSTTETDSSWTKEEERKKKKRKSKKKKRQAKKRLEQTVASPQEHSKQPEVISLTSEKQREGKARLLFLAHFFVLLSRDLRNALSDVIKVVKLLPIQEQDKEKTQILAALRRALEGLHKKPRGFADPFEIAALKMSAFEDMRGTLKKVQQALYDAKRIFCDYFISDESEKVLSHTKQSLMVRKLVYWTDVLEKFDAVFEEKFLQWQPVLARMWVMARKKQSPKPSFHQYLENLKKTDSDECDFPRCQCINNECASKLVSPWLLEILHVNKVWYDLTSESIIRHRAKELE